MNFFLPSKTKKVLAESELIQGNLQRNRIYTQDILSKTNLEAILALEARYPALLKARDVEGLEKLNKEAMKLGNKLFPPSPWDGWRENVEVFVVAAIMALAIRTFFLQTFKIPTGSMEPTLYGIEPKLSTELPPNVFVQAYEFLIHGKTYSRVVTQHGGTIDSMTQGSFTIWLEYTDVHIGSETDRIWIRPSDVRQKLHIEEGMQFQPGDVLANYVTQTGDQVLVDKVTYNFRPPRRGEVFIFKTSGIAGLANETGPNQEGSEDFIKRCVGLPGDQIVVKPPVLYVQPDGKPANRPTSPPRLPRNSRRSTTTPAIAWSSGETAPLARPVPVLRPIRTGSLIPSIRTIPRLTTCSPTSTGPWATTVQEARTAVTGVAFPVRIWSAAATSFSGPSPRAGAGLNSQFGGNPQTVAPFLR
jgi:signal peptidase I